MITRFPAVALLVTLVAHSVDPGPAELRFDWPGDLVARVETERTRERNTGTLQSRTARLAYRMQVSSHDEGWLVAHDQFSVQGPSAAQQRESAELLEAVVPDMIVSRDGEFRRVENIAALRAFIEKLVTPLLDRPDVPPTMRRMLERMTSEEGLSQLAAREWQVLVGTWRELPLTDESITARVEEPSPFLPGIVLQMDATARIVERGPCVRAGVSRDCATFELRTVPDPASMQKAIERLTSGIAGLESITYEHLDVVSTAHIRLETDTMVPHELTTTRALETRMRHPVEGVKTGTQTDRRVSRFSYPAP